jgi:hypothetical protein
MVKVKDRKGSVRRTVIIGRGVDQQPAVFAKGG